MLIELVINQYEHAKETLEDFPTETEVGKLVDELEEGISFDVNVTSSDPDTEVEVTTHFEQRARNSATRDLENKLSSAKSALENIQKSAVDSLMQIMQEDLNRASTPHWSWENEDEDSSLWSAEQWLGYFDQIEDTAMFWKKVLVVFPPDHPYLQSTLDNKAVVQRYPIIKSFDSIHGTHAWNWLTPFLNRLKQDNGSNFDYQQAVDRGFRDVWTTSAVQYARTGDVKYKDKCQLLESHGVTPAPAYLDLTGIFASDSTAIPDRLSRLTEIAGVRDLLMQPMKDVDKSFSFRYLAAYGMVSSSEVLAILNTQDPAAAAIFSKHILQHQLQPYVNERQSVRSRKI